MSTRLKSDAVCSTSASTAPSFVTSVGMASARPPPAARISPATSARSERERDAARLERLVERVGDLRREALLHLKALGKHVHETRDLRQADDLLARHVRDVALADE